MFATAGVQLQWCGSRKNCSSWERRIIVTIKQHAPRHLPATALAAAQAFEGQNLQLYLSRIRATTNSSQLPRVLAHVLVHEITHLLQRCDHHAASGVMKAQWNDADYAEMNVSTLPFTPADLHLIRTGLTLPRVTRSPGRSSRAARN
jgi:hypothetical protein